MSKVNLPTFVWNLPQVTVKKDNHNINPEDLLPFDYAKLQEYFSLNPGTNFIDDNVRTVQEIEAHDFHASNENFFNEQKRSALQFLNENSRMIPSTISGIYTELTKFQRTSVAAMLEVEEKKSAKFYSEKNNKVGMVNVSAAVFSDPVGSGKTLVILSLIRIKPLFNEISYDIRPIYCDNMLKYTTRNYANDDTGHRGFIKRTYKKIIPCTIVFAGVSVAKQWASEIEIFTNFKYLEVIDVRGVDTLMAIIENGDINNYDLIIVKNGTVTRDVYLPGDLIKENKNKIGTPYIYNLIGNLRNIAWSRCIIDDFDNSQLPPNASIINACFTWYISSTTKILSVLPLPNSQFTNTSDILMYENVSCGSILRNQFLFGMFNIRNDPDFVKLNNGLTNPIFYAGIYDSGNDGFAKLINSFSGDETKEIVEMLNSGAINTAAERAGVANKSAADIFESILGKNYTLYKTAVSVLQFIEKYDTEEQHAARLPMANITDDADPTYTKGKLFSFKIPAYRYPNLKQIFRDVKAEQEAIYKSTDSSLKRLKENIHSGSCPMCRQPISGINDNVMICRNCSITGCEDCMTIACSFRESGNNIIGMCPMCRKVISIRDMIHVSKDVELLNVVNDNFIKPEELTHEEKLPRQPIAEPIDIHDTNDPNKRTKITALIDIIQGRMPIEFKKISVNMEQLQTGSNSVIENNLPYRKILVFSNYEESIVNIIKAFDLRGISYWRLAGTASNINQISKRFNSHADNAVLIINSSKHCAGLNLQSADWLIYFHKILDHNVETQIAGRGQRIGRKSTLKIGYLLHQNEASDM